MREFLLGDVPRGEYFMRREMSGGKISRTNLTLKEFARILI